MNKEIILALKQRAKEMLDDDYRSKIGAEEIYTIICEWENSFKENQNHEYMSKELARYLTCLISKDLDKMSDKCTSSYECEMIEERLKQGKFEEIENYLRRKNK